MSILHLKSRTEVNAEVNDISYEEYLEMAQARQKLVEEVSVLQRISRQVSERLRSVREVHPQYATWETKGYKRTPTSSG